MEENGFENFSRKIKSIKSARRQFGVARLKKVPFWEALQPCAGRSRTHSNRHRRPFISAAATSCCQPEESTVPEPYRYRHQSCQSCQSSPTRPSSRTSCDDDAAYDASSLRATLQPPEPELQPPEKPPLLEPQAPAPAPPEHSMRRRRAPHSGLSKSASYPFLLYPLAAGCRPHVQGSLPLPCHQEMQAKPAQS